METGLSGRLVAFPFSLKSKYRQDLLYNA